MKAADVQLHLLSAITHGIETAGALLDNLPYKAKGQGRKRFDLALKKLFPASYGEANGRISLYTQLRSHLSHCMIPANNVAVSPVKEHHLHFDGKLLEISLCTLYVDYRCAILKLIQLIEEGKLKNKLIQFENVNSL